MRILKVVSALLCYPQPELIAALPEIAAAIAAERALPRREREALLAFVDRLERSELLTLQEQYVALFDRGRALSLHLFEHVHGESRERGAAMVELLELYRRAGFELAARELPDYLPLLLEFLSQRPAAEARELLGDAGETLALLGARLAERGSDYHVLFDALGAIAGAPATLAAIRAQAASEGPDPAIVDMDKLWEEEAVTFLAPQQGGGCPSAGAGRAAQPLQRMPRPAPNTPH